jgi:hypothetical protein
MSERDMVHKEMEALQEQLSKSQDRLKKYARESVAFSAGAGAGGGSIYNYNDLNLTMDVLDTTSVYSPRQNNKVNSIMFGYSSLMDDSLEIDSLRQQINVLKRQRDDALNQVFFLLFIFKSTI